ncbi:MAG: hypothetical protein ACJAYX_002734 [Planctomycetota bacterium]|jgi:hypothetical protein
MLMADRDTCSVTHVQLRRQGKASCHHALANVKGNAPANPLSNVQVRRTAGRIDLVLDLSLDRE